MPRQEPGQKLRFILQLVGWALKSAWVFFRGFPGWVRVLVYAWIGILILSKGCMPSDDHAGKRAATVAAEQAQEAEQAAKLNTQLTRDVTGAVAAAGEAAGSSAHRPLLAIPFSAPAGDAAAQALAASVFAKVYGKVLLSHPGQVRLNAAPLSVADAGAAIERGRAHHARYVLFGAVDEGATPHSLSIRMVSVADGSVLWSQSFPVAGADPARIAAAVDAGVPSLADGND